MRITEATIAFDFLFNVNNSRERINELQNQLASGKRVLKPSDDPAGADTILRLRASLDRNEQFTKNVADAQGMLQMTGSALDNFGTLLQEVQETLTQAINGSQSTALSTHANRLDKILDEAVDIANTTFNGKYLFAGTQTQTPPYAVVTNPGPPPTQSVTFGGNANALNFLVGEGISQQVSVSGQEAFMGTAIFDKIIQLRDSLRNGVAPTQADITAVTGMLQTVSQTGGKVGSLLQSLDNTTIHLEEQRTQLLALLSVHQDTDVAEATLRLKHEEIMLDAALNTGAQIIPKSLLDFLK